MTAVLVLAAFALNRIGGVVGFFCCALLTAASRADDAMGAP